MTLPHEADHDADPDRRLAHNRVGSMPGTFDDSVYQRLLRDRIIFLQGEVRDDMANLICAQLLSLSADDPAKDIALYINSPGGSVTAGMAIYDTMQLIPNDVATYTMGLAASMGQFLLTAGAAGKRHALPNAEILMHQPLGGIGGVASDIKIQAERMIHMKKMLFTLISLHSGQTVEQITADAERDKWFSAEEAQAYGLVDHVITTVANVA
jgi:ATP-dependent Clp protease, protease subunit